MHHCTKLTLFAAYILGVVTFFSIYGPAVHVLLNKRAEIWVQRFIFLYNAIKQIIDTKLFNV